MISPFLVLEDVAYADQVVDGRCLVERGYELSPNTETINYGEFYDLRVRKLIHYHLTNNSRLDIHKSLSLDNSNAKFNRIYANEHIYVTSRSNALSFRISNCVNGILCRCHLVRDVWLLVFKLFQRALWGIPVFYRR